MSDNTWAQRINAQPMFDVLELANAQESKGNYVARMEIGDTPGFKNERTRGFSFLCIWFGNWAAPEGERAPASI